MVFLFQVWAMMCFMSSTHLCFISCTILASTCINFLFIYSLCGLISHWAIVYGFILILIPRSHPYFYFGNYFCILLYTWKSTKFFTLIPLDKVKSVSPIIRFVTSHGSYIWWHFPPRFPKRLLSNLKSHHFKS